MTTLQQHVPAALSPAHYEETQALDNYVLATRIVHRAETLLANADGCPDAIAHIEAAFAIALSVTPGSTWAVVRLARQHLDSAKDLIDALGLGLG